MINNNVFLFCEGKANGLDWIVMNHIKQTIRSKIISIHSFGGIGGSSKFIEGFIEGKSEFITSLGTIPKDKFVGFRDRDFDFNVPIQPQLIRAGNNIYAGYRTTIENYLLNFDLFSKYVDELKSEKYNEFKDVSNVTNLFKRASEMILEYQAARFALGEIRNDKAQQKTNFRDLNEERKERNLGKYCYLKSESLPEALTSEYCRQESYKVIDTFEKESKTYSREKFDQLYEAKLKQFKMPVFIEEAQYLIYFQGKTLKTAIKRLLPDGFPLDGYFEFAARNFDFTQHPDLVELKNIIEAL